MIILEGAAWIIFGGLLAFLLTTVWNMFKPRPRMERDVIAEFEYRLTQAEKKAAQDTAPRITYHGPHSVNGQGKLIPTPPAEEMLDFLRRGDR